MAWRVRIPRFRIVTRLQGRLREQLPDERKYPVYLMREVGGGRGFTLSPESDPDVVFTLPESDVVAYFVSRDLKTVDGSAWP